MKKNLALIIVIILLLLLIVSGIIIYIILNNPKVITQEPIKIDKDMTMVAIGEEPFVNNVKDSKKICKVTLKVETNKEMAELIEYRSAEIRDKINALIRSKTEEDLSGREGQEKLQKEIVTIIQEIIKTEEVKNVFFEEFIVQ